MNYRIAGLCGSLPCPGKTPHEYSEEEYEALLEMIHVPAGKLLIMVSHQPPAGTLNDQVSPGVHVGSKSVRHFIEKHRPLVCFTGHIHEGIAIDHIVTVIVNPGLPGRKLCHGRN
jgi:Icc-related predicted phosphoesterase